MPAFWMEATLYTLDDQEFFDFVNKWRYEVIKGSIRKFLRATLSRIPRRTGFLRGAFSNMRTEYSIGALPGDTGGNSALREYYTHGRGLKVLKTPTSGIPFATKAADTLRFNDNVATFLLDIEISYYRINDNFHRIKGSPWNSLLEGGSVMANALGAAADLFPAITQILAKQKIVQRGSGINQTRISPNIIASRALKITGL